MQQTIKNEPKVELDYLHKLNWNPRFQFAKVNLFSEYFLQE